LQILELLAEVAVLEEEVVRLEEKIMLFRKGLYQEAVNISSSEKNVENFCDSFDIGVMKTPTRDESKNVVQPELNSIISPTNSATGNPLELNCIAVVVFLDENRIVTRFCLDVLR